MLRRFLELLSRYRADGWSCTDAAVSSLRTKALHVPTALADRRLNRLQRGKASPPPDEAANSCGMNRRRLSA